MTCSMEGDDGDGNGNGGGEDDFTRVYNHRRVNSETRPRSPAA